MGRDVSLKPVKLFGVAILLMSCEGLLSRLPGFLYHLNLDFSIDETFMLLDIPVYDIEDILVFRPQTIEEHPPSFDRAVSTVNNRYTQSEILFCLKNLIA